MSVQSNSDLDNLWSTRAQFYGDDHRAMDDLVGVYNGVLPPAFDDFFHEEMHVHLINAVRLAWDDLANLAGKEFPLYVRPDNRKPTAMARAEKLEQIAYGWNAAGPLAGGISMKMLMKVFMWWLVGTANAVGMVLPDYENQSPFFTFRDPRTYFPPVGWSPYTQAAPDDALFAYRMSVGELQRRYKRADGDLAATYLSATGWGGKPKDPDSTFVWVGEYYTDETWMVATLDDRSVLLTRTDQGDRDFPGVNPVVSMAFYSAQGAKGRSIFSDQISLQAAMARMFSAKLDSYDRQLYPLIFTTPLSDRNIKVGPYAINIFDTSASSVPPHLQVVQPSAAIDADQSMALVMGLSRMLNRNPEQMQGLGDANSSKALTTLMTGINTTIREMIWPPAIEVLPQLYYKAACMDLNLWPDVGKQAIGTRKNTPFTVSYRPRVDLKNRERSWTVEPGLGLAGYQGTIELLQLQGGHDVSRRTMLEQGEWTRTPEEEMRRIQDDQMEELIWADLTAKAANGLLKPGAMSRIRKLTEADDVDLFDAIEKLQIADELFITPVAPQGPGPATLGAQGPGGVSPRAQMPIPSMRTMRGR